MEYKIIMKMHYGRTRSEQLLCTARDEADLKFSWVRRTISPDCVVEAQLLEDGKCIHRLKVDPCNESVIMDLPN